MAGKAAKKAGKRKAPAQTQEAGATEKSASKTGGAKMGRPTAYKPSYAAEAQKLCKLGATDADLADFFGVSIRTIERWRVEKADFCRASNAGKAEADDRVERSLYQRAVGYTYEAVKIFMPAGAAAPVYAPFREHVPPDTTAQIFWLKNRRKEEWRDKIDHEHGGVDGNPIEITVRFDGGNRR